MGSVATDRLMRCGEVLCGESGCKFSRHCLRAVAIACASSISHVAIPCGFDRPNHLFLQAVECTIALHSGAIANNLEKETGVRNAMLISIVKM